MTKYYALYDRQNHNILYTGFNSTNLNTIKKELTNYLLLGSFSDEGKKSIENNTLSELLEYYDFELLIKNNHKFNNYDTHNINPYKTTI